MPKNENYPLENLENPKNPGSNVVDELRKSFKPPGAGMPTTPAEKVEDALCQVQNQIREQQMSVEQNLQGSLSKASTHVSDSQAIDTLFALTQQIASVAAQGNEALRSNSQQVNELVLQLQTQLANQQTKVDRQVASSLQQAVSALSDAQNSMFESMAIAEMQQLVKGTGQIMKDVIAPGQVQ